MRFDTPQHPLYCGIDLHARTMYVCMLHQDGELVVQRTMPTSPDALRKTMAPYRDQIVIAVACIVTWDWLAALGAREGIPCVLGHALSLQAIHGGKANNAKLDAPKIAVLLRGGMRPPAYVSPAERRATRDLRRRRMPLTRQRAELLTHVQQTPCQDNLPELGKQSAYKAHRAGVAERFPDAAVQKSREVDLALLDYDDQLRRERALTMGQTAKHHEAHTLSVLQTVPGLGTILSRVRVDDMHDIARFPRVQDCVSYGRLVTGAKESAGKHYGTSGTQSGNASLTWACSEAALWFLRNHPAGQTSLVR